MRIEIGDHAGDGAIEQLLVVEGLDVVALDDGKHAGELAQLVERQGPGALGHCRHAQTDEDARQHAAGNKAEIANFCTAHDVSRGRASVTGKANLHTAMDHEDQGEFAQDKGSTGAPRCRISKYMPDWVRPPVVPALATTSPAATASPTCFKMASLLPYTVR